MEDFLSRFGRHNKNYFAIASLNIRSLPSQRDALKLLVQELNSGTVKINCLCLQEIWCVPPYEDFALSGYNLIFHQRDPSGKNRNAGGGVALWCDSDLTCSHLPDISIFEPRVFEYVFVKILCHPLTGSATLESDPGKREPLIVSFHKVPRLHCRVGMK